MTSAGVALRGRWKISCGVGRADVGYGYGFALVEAGRVVVRVAGTAARRERVRWAQRRVDIVVVGTKELSSAPGGQSR